MNQTEKWVNFLIFIPIAVILTLGISAFSPKSPVKNNDEIITLPPVKTQDNSSGKEELMKRARNEIKDKNLTDFYIKLLPYGSNTELSQDYSNCYSVILKRDFTYHLYYFSGSNNDKLVAIIESGKLEEKILETEIKFTNSTQIAFKPKKTGLYHLSIGNLSSNKTDALMVLTLNEGNIQNPESGTALQAKDTTNTDNEAFMVVEQMPSFGSGDANDFRAWISANLQYPKVAAENGIQGRVFVEYIVEKDGSITNVKVLRGVDPSLDREAIRVVESSPKWNSGKQRGKPVRVTYTFPITFALDGTKDLNQMQAASNIVTVPQVSDDEVFMVVEQMPNFGGGNAQEFRTWVAANMKYPEEAAKNGIKGRVFVEFIVEKDGSISNTKVLRGVEPTLDKEAIRVVELSPKWNPGKQNGKPVRVKYAFPIIFTLDN